MITNLIRLSLTNRVLIVLASAGLLAVGLYTSSTMPVDVFPDFTAPTVTILTEAHGMAPTEVETLVTFPLEAAMNGASGVRRVRSSTAVGFSVVWVEFDWGTDIKTDRQIVAEKLALVRESLPPEVESPVMAPQGSIMGEVFFPALRSETHSPFEMRTLADTTVRRRLLGVEGVAQVTPIGGDVKQYQVVLSPSKLQAYNIAASEVAEALSETNENSTAGIVVDGGQELLVQGMGRVHQLEHIADTVVTVRKNIPIRVGQLGNVQIGAALKRGTSSAMGRPAVILGITKQPNVNTLELTERLELALDEIEATLPAGMTVQRNIFRQADFIETAIRNVEAALRDGAILVVIIVLPIGLIISVKNWHRTPVGRRVSPPNPSLTAADRMPVDHMNQYVGRTGRTLTPLRPVGMCEFDGKRIECMADFGMIERGVQVEGIRVVDRTLCVHPVEDSNDSANV